MDDADRAQQTQDTYFNAARLAASRKASNGLVGFAECEDCGRKIPIKRRLAVPSCTRCIACQSDLEKHMGGRN